MSQLAPERRSPLGAGRWDPFGELEQVVERMRQMLDQTFGGLELPRRGGRDSWSPLVDVTETEDAYVIEADVPGVKRDDLTIELVGNELAVEGETKQEQKQEGTPRQTMRRRGRFEYRLRLPEQVDPDKVEASLADGVLTVRAPKSERAQRRKIEITS